MSNESSSHGAGLKLSLLSGVFLLLLLAFIGFKFKTADDGLESQVHRLIKKEDLLSGMRINLLKSVDIEKGAVMAVTDELSRTLAEQSRQMADAVERDRVELGRIIEQDRLTRETALYEEFNTCWSEMRSLDKMILEYAVENTNLKASSLSFNEGGKTLERFERSLADLGRNLPLTVQGGQAQTLAWEALREGFKVYFLLPPHIAASDPAEMDRIEKEIRLHEESVKESLKELEIIVPEANRPALREAAAAYADFQAVTAEVIRLSRLNTNVKSFELSLGRKRKVAAQCEEILTGLQDAVRSRKFEATK